MPAEPTTRQDRVRVRAVVGAKDRVLATYYLVPAASAARHVYPVL